MLNLFNFIFSILNNKQKLPFKMSKMQHTMISKCEEVFVRNDSTPVSKLVEYRETMVEENRRKRHWLVFCSIIICFSFLCPRIKCYLISRQSAPVKF